MYSTVPKAIIVLIVVIVGISGLKLVHWWVLVEFTIGRPTSVDGVKRLTIYLFILI